VLNTKDTVVKPNTCDDCGRVIDTTREDFMICEDYKIRCVHCFIKWNGVDAS
jgi:hypothetical protein